MHFEGKIYIVLLNWKFGGVETRAYRFFMNLLHFGFDVRFLIISQKPRTQNFLNLAGINFISKKDFGNLCLDMKRDDVFFLFRPGKNGYDVKHFEKFGKNILPFYFEYFEKCKAKKFVYIYGNSELQFLPYYKEVIEAVDFVASAFLVNKSSNFFIVNDVYRNKNIKLEFRKPIWFFNASISPKELKKALQLYNEKKFNKDIKSVVYTGRVTNEKNIGLIIKAFLELEKNKFNKLKIYGNVKETRELFFLTRKFGNNITKYFQGSYNAFEDSEKILSDFSLGINLRKMKVEKYHVLENTVLEYMLYGVVPIIDKDFCPDNIDERNVFLFDDKRENLEDLILNNYKDKGKLNFMRINNLKHLILNNNGKNVVKSFIEFIKNN